MPASPAHDDPRGTLTDVDGITVGHFTYSERLTGCTVILTEGGAVAGVDVRGSAPGTRETDLLDPINTVQEVHAVVLAGGSAFGLDAASGVVRYLRERGIGFATRAVNVPIVPAAVLYDFSFGDTSIWPDATAGYEAASAARRAPVTEGNVGAGAGATVGKILGLGRAMKGGLGSSSQRIAQNIVVGAIVAVNCVGSVIDPTTGNIISGIRAEDGRRLADPHQIVRTGGLASAPTGNTTIGAVATNVRFTKTEMTKVAQMAQDALARTIHPSHTPWDGDTIFALSTGSTDATVDLGTIGALAADVLGDAIVRAVKSAAPIPGFPAHRDLPIE